MLMRLCSRFCSPCQIILPHKGVAVQQYVLCMTLRGDTLCWTEDFCRFQCKMVLVEMRVEIQS